MRCALTAGREACVATSTHPLQQDRVRTFSPEEIADVRVVERFQDRHYTYDVHLRLGDGAERCVLIFASADEARDAKGRLSTWLNPTGPERPSTVEVSDRPDPHLRFWSSVALLLGLWLMLRDAGRDVFVVDYCEGGLVVARRIFGVPVMRRVLHLDNVEKVIVDRGARSAWFSRGWRQEGARFEIILRDGRRLPLSKRYHRDSDHQATADAVNGELSRLGRSLSALSKSA